MKNSIKRAQSQACLNFAERKNFGLQAKYKILSLLVLLLTAASGAWADELQTEYTSDATLNNVTVSADMEIAIGDGAVVTINKGLTIAEGKTLTVNGPGKLVVNGANVSGSSQQGSNGSTGGQGGQGTQGGAAISGNIIIKGATVNANGGSGGTGGTGGSGMSGSGGQGGQGGQGGAAFDGAVTIFSGTIIAKGGSGGTGGSGGVGIDSDNPGSFIQADQGPGGDSGYAFAGTLTFYGGTVNVLGSMTGYGKPNGNASNAFVNPVTMKATTYELKGGSYSASDVIELANIVNYRNVSIVAADAKDPSDLNVEPVEGKTNEWTFTMPGYDVVLTPIYAPTKVTLAANDVQKGSVSMGGETKVEWTPTTWSGWSSGQNTEMTKSDGGITMTYTNAADQTYGGSIMENGNSHALDFFINENIDDCTVTFSSDEGNISRIELSMTEEYSENTIPNTTITYGNPHILPLDGWTFNGKSAVWEGEATNSLKLSSCSTTVEKITFYKDGGIPEGVTVNTDGTFTVAQTATVKVKATPAEGYKLKGWSDAPDCTDLVREITIEPGEEDMLITAIFEEMTYTATFTAANANTIEAGKATVTVDSEQKTLTDGKLPEVKKDAEVKIKAATGYKLKKVEVKKHVPKINVGGLELIGEEGQAWSTIVANNPDKIEIVETWLKRKDADLFLKPNDNSYVNPNTDSYNSSYSYTWYH